MAVRPEEPGRSPDRRSARLRRGARYRDHRYTSPTPRADGTAGSVAALESSSTMGGMLPRAHTVGIPHRSGWLEYRSRRRRMPPSASRAARSGRAKPPAPTPTRSSPAASTRCRTTRLTPGTSLTMRLLILEHLVRQLRPVGRHPILGRDGADRDDVRVDPAVAHHADRADRREDREALPQAAIQVRRLDLVDDDPVASRNVSRRSAVTSPMIRIARPGPGNG